MTRPPVRGDDEWADDGSDEWAEEDADWSDDPEAPAYEYVEEYEELPPEVGKGKRALVVLALVLGFFVLVLGGAAYYLRGQLDPSGAQGAEVRFTIPTGSSATQVASLLEEQGIIEDAQVFRWYLRFKGEDSFLAGDYLLHENMAAWDVLAGLQVDPLPLEVADFTVPEGLTMFEIPAAIVDDLPSYDSTELADIILGMGVRPTSLPAEAPNLEGFLFPDTYQVEPGDAALAVLQRMATQFDVVAAELDLANRAAALGRSPYEIVIIASLIQEEYGITEEMSKIARVIYNRLEVEEPLGIDATSRYEAVLEGRDRNDIDLDSPSAYNTRRQRGLPPTPIASPGRAALEAALAPAEGDWIFYVRDPDPTRTPEGGHFFTESASEFAEVKAECEAANLGCG